MLERTKRISFRISSVLSKVEPEPDLHIGSDRFRLCNTEEVHLKTMTKYFTLLGSGTTVQYCKKNLVAVLADIGM